MDEETLEIRTELIGRGVMSPNDGKQKQKRKKSSSKGRTDRDKTTNG